MSSENIQHVELRVPRNSGALIGNTLRQFAMRGNSTWQIIAYNIGKKEKTFGAGSDYNFSYLDLISGKLIYRNGPSSFNSKLFRFDKVGDEYVCEDMKIIGLSKLQIPSLHALLVYASGSRTAEDNYRTVKQLYPEDAVDYIVVPSRHTPAINFSYSVGTFSGDEEVLNISATSGIISDARKSAIETLQSLDIE